MRLTLEVQAGPDEGLTFTVSPGPEVRIGRKSPAHFVVPGDPTMSRAHFAITCDGRSCRVRDLGSTAGTEVNGVRVAAAVLHDGDVILAGSTHLAVRIDRPPLARARPPRTPAPATRSDDDGTQELEALTDRSDLVLQRLRKAPGPLFAILDAAREPLVLARVLHCEEQYESLYEGVRGQRLAASAPYLVALPPASAFLETVVREGWGKSWGIFLTCPSPFQEVRKHLRRFLMVKPEGGAECYFRFYDPRVLRVFLPTCGPEELAHFFGPIRGIVMEGEGADELLRFEVGDRRLKREVARLAPETSAVRVAAP